MKAFYSLKRIVLLGFFFNINLCISYVVFIQGFPSVQDNNLHLDLVTSGLKFPTAMDFLGPNDILVTEKDNGTVRRILNGELQNLSVLDTNVANKYDRGLLGIAISKIKTEEAKEKSIYVYIYLTESKTEGSDHCISWRSCLKGGEPEGNRLYRYKWDGQKLIEPKLLLDLPAVPGPAHNGGSLMLGP
ncbi:MAG TPA: PQQ-dependent sugar dehydrogenase, partial [Nitrososphaeraceae archaeon]|nr:PQQ-dependent sugar dehydrogenase [Nitrososphaeraceae archaeon]